MQKITAADKLNSAISQILRTRNHMQYELIRPHFAFRATLLYLLFNSTVYKL